MIPHLLKIQNDERKIKESQATEAERLTQNPIDFFHHILGFTPTSYQLELTQLFLNNQFIAARWCRQSGKSHIVSALLLWHALTHPDTHIGIVAPSLRQAKLIIRRITQFVRKLPKGTCTKPLRTVVSLTNGSVIEAFPNSPETIRGPSLHIVYCLPNYVNVTLADGSRIPIRKVKVGQKVLTYNKAFCRVEPKRVLKVFRNPIGKRTHVRVFHNYGYLDCTAEHKVFTFNRGYVPSSLLQSDDKILYLADITNYKVGARNKVSLQSSDNRDPRAADLRRTFRRFMYAKTEKQEEKHSPCHKSLFKTSGICSIQIFNPKEPRENSAKTSSKQRVGKTKHAILYFITSKVHRNLSDMLSKWQKNCFTRMVKENQLAVRISNLVYGRWFSWKKGKYEDQHPQIFKRGTPHFPTMATKPLEYKGQNCRGQTWQRILFNVLSGGARQILQVNPFIRYSEYALQSSPRIEACTMCNMWQTSSAQKSCPLSGKENCLLKSRMQENFSEIKSRLETQKTEDMCGLRENFHAHTRQDEDMFICLSKNLETSKKTTKTTKQKAVTPSPLPSMRSYIQPFKWSSKNLQPRMSQRTTQKILENTVISNALRVLRQSFPFSDSKAKILQCKMSGTNALPQKEEKNEIVYNLEVEDNHNFFADDVLVSNCDEMNFLPNDQEMYDAILFTLGTTNGKFICTSTPWSTDSLFHKICNHKDYTDYTKHHITWQQAVEPQGPLKRNILEKIRKQLAGDPWRWKREMEAEWSEDETVWLTQSLITKCIDGTLELQSFDSKKQGRFYAGLDLGKHQDHSVLVVIEELEGRNLLRHWKVFPLETKYATVIGYVKTLTDRWKHIEKIRVDTTGVGEYIVEDMKNADIENVEPVTFTANRKQELATILKQRMLDAAYRFPFAELRLSPTFQISYVAELNVERFALRKDGTIAFSHPQGQHDDTWWATTLAVSCSVRLSPEPYLAVTT